MIERLTVGKLKELLKQYKVPDDAIVCCQSDEEGNREMVCCDMFIDRVGRKERLPDITYTCGVDVLGIDIERDFNRTYITFRPMY